MILDRKLIIILSIFVILALLNIYVKNNSNSSHVFSNPTKIKTERIEKKLKVTSTQKETIPLHNEKKETKRLFDEDKMKDISRPATLAEFGN